MVSKRITHFKFFFNQTKLNAVYFCSPEDDIKNHVQKNILNVFVILANT